MKDQLTDEQNAEIIKALNKAIEEGPWDKSNFLKVIGKNLIGIRDNFLTHLGASSQAQLKAESHLANQMALRSNQQEIYISLYASDGINIQNWERIVANLPRQMISRPIYASEEDIKDVLKCKENKLNEAYVAIYVNKNDIITLAADKVPTDRLGKKLLTLKDRILDLENVSRFVHTTGVYHYSKGRLIKDS